MSASQKFGMYNNYYIRFSSWVKPFGASDLSTVQLQKLIIGTLNLRLGSQVVCFIRISYL